MIVRMLRVMVRMLKVRVIVKVIVKSDGKSDGDSNGKSDGIENSVYWCFDEASEYKGWVIKLVLTTPVKF